jgi:hypothetical protein
MRHATQRQSRRGARERRTSHTTPQPIMTAMITQTLMAALKTFATSTSSTWMTRNTTSARPCALAMSCRDSGLAS